MRVIKIVVIALALSFGATIAAAQSPKNSTIFDSRIGAYGPVQFDMDINAYEAAVSAKDFDRAKAIRDRVVWNIKAAVDVPYGAFKTSLYTSTAKKNTIFDILEDVALAAIGITRNVRTKDIIATVLQGGKSIRKSYDANFLKGQTLWMVITAMDAGRLEAFTKIEEGLDADVLTYSLYQAIGDEVGYAQAGTIEGGLQRLGDQVGTALQSAQAKAADFHQSKVEQSKAKAAAKPNQ